MSKGCLTSVVVLAVIGFAFAYPPITAAVLVSAGTGWALYYWYRHDNIRKAMPQVRRFVTSYVPTDTTWPDNISIPTEDVSALATILRTEQVYVSTQQLAEAVQSYLRQVLDQKFAQAFFALHPDLDAPSSREGVRTWAWAYVDTFENNPTYLPYLVGLAQSRNRGIQEDALVKAVHSEIASRAHQRRVEAVAQAMREGRARPRTTIELVDT